MFGGPSFCIAFFYFFDEGLVVVVDMEIMAWLCVVCRGPGVLFLLLWLRFGSRLELSVSAVVSYPGVSFRSALFVFPTGESVYVCRWASSELRDVIEDFDFLAWLEGRQADYYGKESFTVS